MTLNQPGALRTGVPTNGELATAVSCTVFLWLSRSARQPKVKRARSPEAQSTELRSRVQQEPGMEPKHPRLSKPQKGRVDGIIFRGSWGAGKKDPGRGLKWQRSDVPGGGDGRWAGGPSSASCPGPRPPLADTDGQGELTGPMLIHLEKRSSATMCSYSLWTAHCRRLVLWWRSYRLHKAAGMRVSAGTGHREECQPQPGPGTLDGQPHLQPTPALSASVSSCATAPLPPRPGHRGSPAVSAPTDGAGPGTEGRQWLGPPPGEVTQGPGPGGPALLPQRQTTGPSKALSSESCHLGAPPQARSKAEDRAVLRDPRHTRLATV